MFNQNQISNIMKTTENQQVKRQSKSINKSGSFINWLYSNNMSVPKVGKGATICHWSDRDACEVLEVSKDGKTVVIDTYMEKRIDNNGMSECQEYEYTELMGNPQTVVWYRGKWRFKGSEIVYTDEYFKNCGSYFPAHSLTEEQHDAIYGGEMYPQNVVDGITRKKTKYREVNIIFGVKEHYYDFSF